jgi:hypothetical protein
MGAVALGLVIGGSITAAAITPPPDAALPVFAPDEPLVLSAHLTGAGGGLFVRPADGSDAQQLATDVLPGAHKHPDWSPDGQAVVFIDEVTERMWIAHLDGSPTEAVAACDTPGRDYPAWSPDGSRIAFSRYENADGVIGPAALGIHTVDLATGEVTPVVRLERPCSPASRAGRRMAMGSSSASTAWTTRPTRPAPPSRSCPRPGASRATSPRSTTGPTAPTGAG